LLGFGLFNRNNQEKNREAQEQSERNRFYELENAATQHIPPIGAST